MKSKVICMASAKGGSGKTTLTATFGHFLTAIGKSVLVIDCDESTNGMTLLYLDKVVEYRRNNREFRGLFDTPLSPEVSIVTISEEVSLIPASFDFGEKTPIDPSDFFELLDHIIRAFENSYDYILLDSQAGLDTVSRVTMNSSISETVVIVSEYDPLSTAGVERLKSTMGEHLNSTRTWILLNKMLPEFIESFSEFLAVARYLPPIPWTAEVVRAYSQRRLALDLEYGNEYTLAILQTLKSLLPSSDVEELNAWAFDRAEDLKRPIRVQLMDAEAAMRSLYDHKSDLKDRHIRSRFLMLVPAFFVFALLVGSYPLFLDLIPEGSEFRGLFKSSFVFPVVFIGMLTSMFLFSIYPMLRRFLGDYDFEGSRLDLELERAEEEYKKLSRLQHADLEDLVRKK